MFNEVLNKFLTKQQMSVSEEELLVKELKKIAKFAIRPLNSKKLKSILSSENVEEEILNGVVIKLIEKKKIVISKIDENRSMKSYISALVKNYIKDKLKKKLLELEEIENLEENAQSSSIKPIVMLEAKEFMEISKRSLTVKEKEAICLDIAEVKQIGYAVSKAKSRAKERLRNIAISNGFSFDAVDYAINMFFLSEICKKFVIINEE